MVSNNYRAAPYFSHYKDWFEKLFLDTCEDHLSQVNHRFLIAILDILGITTKRTLVHGLRAYRGEKH